MKKASRSYGKNGLLTDVGNTEQMVACMRRMLTDAALRKSCAEEALKLNDQLCVDRIVDQWHKCMNS